MRVTYFPSSRLIVFYLLVISWKFFDELLSVKDVTVAHPIQISTVNLISDMRHEILG